MVSVSWTSSDLQADSICVTTAGCNKHQQKIVYRYSMSSTTCSQSNQSQLENVTIANALQLETTRATPVLSHFKYDAMPSLKSPKIRGAVGEISGSIVEALPTTEPLEYIWWPSTVYWHSHVNTYVCGLHDRPGCLIYSHYYVIKVISPKKWNIFIQQYYSFKTCGRAVARAAKFWKWQSKALWK